MSRFELDLDQNNKRRILNINFPVIALYKKTDRNISTHLYDLTYLDK